MFIEAVIGSFVGATFAGSKRPCDKGVEHLTTNVSDIRDKRDGINNTLSDMKSKISDIEIEQSRMFHEFQWHDLVQTLMAKNAVYRGNNILELTENDSVIQLNLVERSITETKFGITYEKTFDGYEYIDGKCVHYKDTTCEKWFDLEGKCIHEVESNGKQHWYEYDTSNRCIHKKNEHGKEYAERWLEFDADGNVIRRRIKQKRIVDGVECLKEILVEYGNVIHIVSKYDETDHEEYYFTTDVVKDPIYEKRLISYIMDRIRLSRWTNKSQDGLIYYVCFFGEQVGNEQVCGIGHYFDERNNEIWYDDKGEIKKGFYNFLTHAYEKRIAIAKHKLEEAKSIIKNSI